MPRRPSKIEAPVLSDSCHTGSDRMTRPRVGWSASASEHNSTSHGAREYPRRPRAGGAPPRRRRARAPGTMRRARMRVREIAQSRAGRRRGASPSVGTTLDVHDASTTAIERRPPRRARVGVRALTLNPPSATHHAVFSRGFVRAARRRRGVRRGARGGGDGVQPSYAARGFGAPGPGDGQGGGGCAGPVLQHRHDHVHRAHRDDLVPLRAVHQAAMGGGVRAHGAAAEAHALARAAGGGGGTSRPSSGSG